MVSIIIVNYHVKEELFRCIESVIASKAKISYEIIVVDNDETVRIKKELQKKFPKVIYSKSPGNIGFGAGNNRGAKLAKGEYLFFLNPDTIVYPHILDNLVAFLKKEKDAGIVAPLLLDMKKKPYQQGTLELTPWRALFSLSIINKFFPHNPVAKQYWLMDWDKKTPKEVSVAPGTAFLLRKTLYEEASGFDEKFFLFFEEFDLCKRIKELGYKIFITPTATLSHEWGVSTKKRNDIQRIFNKSRFYYFKKHFGVLQAILVETFLRFDKYKALFIVSIAIATFLSLYRLPQLMPFIGDQGWFYLSARDMLTTGNIPLVGIASSHPWLHQGALWTYLLAGTLALFNFHPVSGAYLTIGFHLLTILFIFLIGSRMFSERVGGMAALLYATSPLTTFFARMPYHTSPIPFFTLIYLFALYQWVKGNKNYFPMIIASLALLYNLEIATFLLTIVFVGIFLFGIWKKKSWAKSILHFKFYVLSFLAFVIPMLPMLVYDLGHGFPQTFKFLVWIGYKMLVFFGYPPLHPEIASADIRSVFIFLGEAYQKLIYSPSGLVAFTIGIFSFGFFYKKIFDQMRSKKYQIEFMLVGIIFVVSLAGIIATKTTSDAYIPILFPLIIFITALFFDRLLQRRVQLTPVVWLILGIIVVMNSTTLVFQNYFMGEGKGFSDKLMAAREIVSDADGKRYTIVGKGSGSQYESFTMPYEYLTWWLGNGPSQKQEQLQFLIREDEQEITVSKND